MNIKIREIIAQLSTERILEERKIILQPLIEFISSKISKNEEVRLNFICTHNSRRSHLSQIWAQTMANYYQIENVFCYSGGTEATAMFPKVAETLTNQGFEILKLSETENPVYAVKFAENEHAVICFSKNIMMILTRRQHLRRFSRVILLMKIARLFTVQKLEFQ